ncbi:MAG: DCC1-like thiol-disulfide oxidoreductase family protein [Acidobacteriota bacterium]
MTKSSGNQLLLYDGVCGFCNQSIRTILSHDKQGTLKFAPLQSELGKKILARHHLENIDSLIFVENYESAERLYVRSSGALKVANYLGGWWKFFLIFYIIPRPIRDFFYDLFARYRYRLFGKYDHCLLPAPEVRARFLDMA